MPTERVVPVIELGGTHVTAALVSLSGHAGRAITVVRVPVDADGSATTILDQIAAAARCLGVDDPTAWGMALPGPFDYANGIGDFAGVAKFASLSGVDVGRGLRERVATIRSIAFINDAAAFGLGEAKTGAGAGTNRCVCLTLGTGVGSAFVADGRVMSSGSGVPEQGWIHTIAVNGKPLEDSMSRRALRRADGTGAEVDEIAAQALAGDQHADHVFGDAYRALATGLAPLLVEFEAERLVIGGSIATSWQLVERHLVPALVELGAKVPVRPAAEPELSALVGAALTAPTSLVE